jgi:hypothetical protein
MHVFRWRSQKDTHTPGDIATTSSPTKPLRRFAVKAEKILNDFRELELRLASENAQRPQISKQVASRRSRHEPRRPTIYGERVSSHGVLAPGEETRNSRTSSAFDSFCERLLLMNRIWKQEKEMRELRASLNSKTKSKPTTAFKTFCDQLLLWNRIWKLEKEVKLLVAEGEKMKRSRVMAITRAAKQMVLDVQKERLVEEFVKDLIEEVEESKRNMESMREAHEREIEEMNGEWMKDYRAVMRELDSLKLAQETRLLEQEITNEEDDSLFKNLLAGKRRVEELEKKIAEYEEQGYASSSDDTVVASTSKRYDTASAHHDASTDIELDLISETSSSRTCVSTGHDTGRQTKALASTQRKRCMSLRSPYEGRARTSLSLKPLILDHARSGSVSALESSTSVATRTCNHSGRPIAFRNRTLSSISLRTLPAGTREKASGEVSKRAPWR